MNNKIIKILLIIPGFVYNVFNSVKLSITKNVDRKTIKKKERKNLKNRKKYVVYICPTRKV